MVDPSWKVRKIRLTAGSKGILPEPCTRTTNESNSPDATVRVALGPKVGGFIQDAVEGFHWQRLRVSGRGTFPVFASAVIVPPTKATFTDPATIKFAPFGPGRLTLLSLVAVIADAIRSTVGVVEAENKKVLTPGTIGAGSLFVQSKLKVTFVGAMGLEGVSAKIKHPAPPAGMSMGILGELTGRLVAQLVVWNEKVAGRLVTGAILQLRAVPVP